MYIKQVRTSACETIYDVDGTIIRLWIVTGGTPCISFEDFSYQHRYEGSINLHQWSNKHWSTEHCKNGCYLHQNLSNPQGPEPDVLPHGEATIAEYLATYIPRKKLAKDRYEALPVSRTIKKRKHDREERTYVTAELTISPNAIHPITFSSGHCRGRHDEKVQLFGSWWIRAQSIFNPIFDNSNGLPTWDVLSESEYKAVVEILADKACPATA